MAVKTAFLRRVYKHQQNKWLAAGNYLLKGNLSFSNFTDLKYKKPQTISTWQTLWKRISRGFQHMPFSVISKINSKLQITVNGPNILQYLRFLVFSSFSKLVLL